jgi:hypothetical protein
MKPFGKDKMRNFNVRGYTQRRRVYLILFCIIFNVNPVFAKRIAAGVDYNQYISESQQIIYVVTIDPKQVVFKSVHANDKVQGLETVASLARHEKAIVGINGSFFHMGEKKDGHPAGILKIAGRWFGIAYGARGALGWSTASIDNPAKDNNVDNSNNNPSSNNANSSANSNSANPNSGSTASGINGNEKVIQPIKVLMDRVQTKTSVEINGSKFPVQGVNQPATLSKGILYTDAYGSETDSIVGGVDVVIENDKVQAILPAGKTIIPRGGYVYAMGPKAKRPNTFFAIGDAAQVQIKVSPIFQKNTAEDWQTIENIVGGIPLLIENGRVLEDYAQERIKASFSQQQYARTAVGIKASGHWVFVVVEKSQATGSPGMNLLELSSFLQDLGCTRALNLDGGGSSTLYVAGKVVNNTENELNESIILPIARPVGDAILVLPKIAAE